MSSDAANVFKWFCPGPVQVPPQLNLSATDYIPDHPTAYPVASFEHYHVDPGLGKGAGRNQTGNASPYHYNAD